MHSVRDVRRLIAKRKQLMETQHLLLPTRKIALSNSVYIREGNSTSFR